MIEDTNNKPSMESGKKDSGLSLEATKQLSDNLASILSEAAKDQVQWTEQWGAWVSSMMSQGQFVSPEALVEVEQRQRAFSDLVLQFKPTGEVLAKIGLKDVSKFVEIVEKGVRESATSRHQTDMKIMAGNLKNQQANFASQQATNKYVTDLHNQTMAEQRRMMAKTQEDINKMISG